MHAWLRIQKFSCLFVMDRTVNLASAAAFLSDTNKVAIFSMHSTPTV